MYKFQTDLTARISEAAQVSAVCFGHFIQLSASLTLQDISKKCQRNIKEISKKYGPIGSETATVSIVKCKQNGNKIFV